MLCKDSPCTITLVFVIFASVGEKISFKYFVKTFAPEKIISYSDLRYFTGNSLRKLGFNKEKETDSGYGYTDTYHRVFHRLQFTKKKLVNLGNDPALTEWEIMQANGYDRIWDCGNAVWKWTS